jgi:hypothetical protein
MACRMCQLIILLACSDMYNAMFQDSIATGTNVNVAIVKAITRCFMIAPLLMSTLYYIDPTSPSGIVVNALFPRRYTYVRSRANPAVNPPDR